jgi:hypothetical protein
MPSTARLALTTETPLSVEEQRLVAHWRKLDDAHQVTLSTLASVFVWRQSHARERPPHDWRRQRQARLR